MAAVSGRARFLAEAAFPRARAVQQPISLSTVFAPLQTLSTITREMTTVSETATSRPNVKDGKVLHPDLMNERLVNAEYAVRGELYNKAVEMSKRGRHMIYTNIGNPQQLGQEPLLFNRQVLSLLMAPFVLDTPQASELFSKEAIERARKLLDMFDGKLGAYTDARGVHPIREEVAAFIAKRDGHPADPESIFLTEGASAGVKTLLESMIRDENDGILCPIPQYPLYSATITLLGGQLVPYYLDEDAGWDLSMEELRRALKDARSKGIVVRALVFINPGNPTGQVLSAESLRDLVRLAYDEGLFLIADEVYQSNIYDEKPFVSAKKALRDLGEPYASAVELASLHTVSKGIIGECGLRGGYMEMTNLLPGTMDQLGKAASINLCPNTVGQATVSLMVNPPTGDNPAAKQFAAEYNESLESLRRRARVMTDVFNGLEGITCNETEGAMYSFPRLHLPRRAQEAARAAGKTPDTFYCLELLEETGIVTVPGSGFGEREGAFHLRTTILPPESVIGTFVDSLRTFHKGFMDRYRD